MTTAPSADAVYAAVQSREVQRLLPKGTHADDVYECVREILTAAMPEIRAQIAAEGEARVGRYATRRTEPWQDGYRRAFRDIGRAATLERLEALR